MKLFLRLHFRLVYATEVHTAYRLAALNSSADMFLTVPS